MSGVTLIDKSCRQLLLVTAATCVLAESSPAQLLFGPPASTPLGGVAAASVAAGDIDGDFYTDLVIGHAGAPGLRLNDGTGQFAAETPIAVGASGSTVLLANVDQTGSCDLLVGSSLTGLLHVAHGDGRDGFEAASSYPLGPTTPSVNTLSLDAWDYFGVLAVTAGTIGGSAGEARVFRMLDDGALELTGVITPGSSNRIVRGVVGPLNDDEWPDVVLQLDSGTTSAVLTVAAYVGQPGGSFVPTWSQADSVLGRLGALPGDVDTHLDLVTLGTTDDAIISNGGVGDGTFALRAVSEIVTAQGVTVCGVADLAQDYIPDLVLVRSSPAELWVMLGLPGGGYELDSKVTLSPEAPGLAAGTGLMGDFDNGVGGGPVNFDAAVPVGLGTATASLKVCSNRSYLGGLPLLDLGHQLQGTSWPIQIVTGSFEPGTPFAFQLFAALPSKPVFHVAGFALLEAPFKGGTMVPHPFLVTGPLLTSPAGELTLAGASWPGGPSGLLLASQFWFADPNGQAGFAASSGMRIILPP